MTTQSTILRFIFKLGLRLKCQVMFVWYLLSFGLSVWKIVHNPVDGSWTRMPDLKRARYGHSCAVLNDKGQIIL